LSLVGRFPLRKLASLVLVGALLATLAACTSTASAKGAGAIDGCTPVQPGKVSNSINVTGKYGKEPTVKFKSPTASLKTTQRTVITLGKGKVAKKGSKVNVDFAIYNGTSGKELTSTKFDGATVPLVVDTTQTLTGLAKTLQCSPVGTRVVGVIPPADAFKTAGSTDLGVAAKDNIVFVADVVSFTPTALKTATGATQAPLPGFPTVVFSSKGLPTVTVPKAAAPTKYEEEVLIKGKGKTVAADSNVTVNYQLVLWRTGKVVAGNDTWAAGKTADFNTGQVVPGFKKGLEGQTVGSRVLMVLPPSEGYGTTGSSAAGITGTDDLVFLVDILAVD
jgi:peptidylprolyl isomerase